MVRVRPVSNGKSYAAYMRQEAEIGQWLGEGAELLGLSGEITLEEFRALRNGLDPKTGETLRKNQGDRVYQKPWGEMEYKAREFFELTISAPKSVSLQGIVDPQVIAAHEKAVQQVVNDLEYVTQGQLVMGVWQHRMSRAGDPQLHTHVAVMNVAHDENGWHGLRSYPLFENQKQFTSEYRATLLGDIERHGYEIQYPEIRGISEEFREKYSQRAQQIDREIDKFKESQGVYPDGNEMQRMVLRTRPDKQFKTAKEIMEEQYNSLTHVERVNLLELATEAHHRQSIYVAPHIQNRYGGPFRFPEAKHPELVIDDWAPGSYAEQPEQWTYGETPKQSLGM